MEIIFQPIGTIFSPFKDLEGIPIQPQASPGVKGKIVLLPEYGGGLLDLDGFSHIILLYFFHKSSEYSLLVTPFLDDEQHGVFATRAPRRPNQIGLSVVKLVKIENNVINIEDVDILNGTPLLDIKPYIPMFDEQEVFKTGWLGKLMDELGEMKSDRRFLPD